MNALAVTTLGSLRPLDAKSRGMALLVVVFVMLVILVGGLAAVALVSGDLSSAGGYRARSVADSCAAQALYQLHALTTDPTNPPQYTAAAGNLSLGSGGTLPFAIGHYDHPGVDGSSPPVWRTVSGQFLDSRSFYEGQNVTNLVPGGGMALQVVAATAICGGGSSGYGQREMEIITTTGSSTAH